MGAFFTNVQVRADAKAPEATHKALVDAIGARASDEGFTPCSDASKADRTLIVGPPDPWIAVYDQATESQRLEPLDGLAAFLSGVMNGPAVGVLVHDSEHLLLRLFENGALTDALERGTGKKKGKVEAWAKAFPAKASDLRAALERRDLFVEETLRDVALALAMDSERACTGYRYLHEEGPIPDGSVVMRLRRVERPAHHRAALGAPRLVASAFHPRAELSVGGPLHVAASVRNEGGPSRGLSVAVHGDAIDALLVEPERVQIVVGVPGKGVVVERAFDPRKTLTNGKPGYVLDLPELDIPAGNARGSEMPTDLDAQAWVESMLTSQVHANVLGTARLAGRARLFVSFVPLEARDAQSHHAIDLAVVAAPRKPLRGAASDPSAYVALETPDVLVALAASTLDIAEAAPIAAELVERWSELWPRGAKLSGAVFERVVGRPTKPRTSTLKIHGLATSAAWKKLRPAFATAGRVTGMGAIDLSAGLRGEPAMRGEGFEFGGTLQGPRTAADPELPTLQLRLGLRGRSDEGDVIARATELVDDFVRRARCAQAFLARWKGDASVGLDATAYERACGIHGISTLRRSWGTRFLRAVSLDGIWLGPALVARVDRAALDAVASVAPVGDALRISPREGVTLDALEAALAPLLPSEADGRAGTESVYGRAEAPPG